MDIKILINLANEFDKNGFEKYASQIDDLVQEILVSEEAHEHNDDCGCDEDSGDESEESYMSIQNIQKSHKM
jgi:hypothetical protein